jgi:hypothetical protein
MKLKKRLIEKKKTKQSIISMNSVLRGGAQ